MPVGFQTSATDPELRVHATRSYSLIRPPRNGRRLAGHSDWALRFPAPGGAKFNAVLEGSFTLAVDSLAPLTLRAGDAFLLTRPAEFVLTTSATAAPRPASPYFRTNQGDVAVVGPPAEPVTARLIGGSFEFHRQAPGLLLDALPPLIHLPPTQREPSLCSRC